MTPAVHTGLDANVMAAPSSVKAVLFSVGPANGCAALLEHLHGVRAQIWADGAADAKAGGILEPSTRLTKPDIKVVKPAKVAKPTKTATAAALPAVTAAALPAMAAALFTTAAAPPATWADVDALGWRSRSDGAVSAPKPNARLHAFVVAESAKLRQVLTDAKAATAYADADLAQVVALGKPMIDAIAGDVGLMDFCISELQPINLLVALAPKK